MTGLTACRTEGGTIDPRIGQSSPHQSYSAPRSSSDIGIFTWNSRDDLFSNPWTYLINMRTLAMLLSYQSNFILQFPCLLSLLFPWIPSSPHSWWMTACPKRFPSSCLIYPIRKSSNAMHILIWTHILACSQQRANKCEEIFHTHTPTHSLDGNAKSYSSSTLDLRALLSWYGTMSILLRTRWDSQKAMYHTQHALIDMMCFH